MTAQMILGRDLQQTLVRDELMRGVPTGGPARCRLISVAGQDPMLDINRELHVRTLVDYGFACDDVLLGEGTDLAGLHQAIDEANDCPDVDGIMVLMPLPPHLSVSDVLGRIAPQKELEGLHPDHSASLLATVAHSRDTVRPLVTEALLSALADADVDLAGRHIVILTDPELMAKNPVANVVVRAGGPACLPLDAVVSIVPIDHPRAAELCRLAQLLVVSLETPEMVDEAFVGEGATVVDFNPNLVGHRVVKGRERPVLKGGVQVDAVAKVAGKVMPVPGGMGPVMLGMLMRNLVRAARRCRTPVA